MRKRTLIAIVISVILVLIVIALLSVNNMKYSECRQTSDENAQAACYAAIANKTSTTGFHVRMNMGSRIIDLI